MKNWKTTKRDGKEGILLRTIDRDVHEFPTSAHDSVSELDKDSRPISVELPEERWLEFAPPGRQIGAKRIYTIKAEKRDGSVVQLALEDQINNNVASPENAIGLQFYSRRGINVFFDFETGEAAFCPSWDCWAKWNPKFEGFCSEVHRTITKGDEDPDAGFGKGATTSRSWG